MRPRVKSTILLSLLGLSLALNATVVLGVLRGATAQARGSVAPQDPDRACLLDRLELDPTQQRRLAEMRTQMQEKRAAYWQRSNAIKAQLAQSICEHPVDQGALEAQLRRYAENQAAMQRAVAEHLLGVSAMLRPQQQEMFQTLLRTEMFRGIRRAPSNTPGAL